MDLLLADGVTDLALPVGLIDKMLDEYNAKVTRINEVAKYYLNANDILGYFLEGNTERGHHFSVATDKLFNIGGAVAALNAQYWQKAMMLTDVLDVMPAARRSEWHTQIHEKKTPDFTADIVKPTLLDLLQNRQRFFAERVDGIFRALSGSHVTNQPQAFGKRMIFAGLVNEWGSLDYRKTEHINDLRAVIAQFMRREQKNNMATERAVKFAQSKYGEWVKLDGGAINIRVYKKGSAHIEVHPDMAWRLNAILASLYPNAIAAPSRTPPKKAIKDFNPIETPLPFEIISVLANLKKSTKSSSDWDRRIEYIPNTVSIIGRLSIQTDAEVKRILTMLGGIDTGIGNIEFDYDPAPVIDELVATGRIPDYKTHQYYPTPEKLARLAVDLAEIQDGDICLEPQAGTGGIAKYMSKDQTVCVELSSLFCKTLGQYASKVINGDFLAMDNLGKFDKIIMNPPFSEGRAKLHTEHAAIMVADNGILVAILPASMKNKFTLDGFAIEWSETFTGDFEMTGVSVSIMRAKK